MSTRQMWNDRYAKKDLVWSAGPNELFATEIRSLKPGKAVDVACGEGRNAIWLAEQEWNVTAIDFSDVAIEKGRQIAAKRQQLCASREYEQEAIGKSVATISRSQFPLEFVERDMSDNRNMRSRRRNRVVLGQTAEVAGIPRFPDGGRQNVSRSRCLLQHLRELAFFDVCCQVDK